MIKDYNTCHTRFQCFFKVSPKKLDLQTKTQNIRNKNLKICGINNE